MFEKTLKRKKLKILFRTSGGSAISKELGFGHIFRSINLAKSLQTHQLFFLIENYGHVKDIFKKNNLDATFIKKNIDLKSDILHTVNFILKKQIDVVIVDKYNTSKNYLRKLKKYSKVVYISDLTKIDFPCDLVVNGYIGFTNKKSKNKYNVPCLLGPSYQILNKNFSRHLKVVKKYDLLATFGGFDEKKIIENILEELSKLSNLHRIKIILGPGTTQSINILNFIKNNNKKITIVQKTKDMHRDISLSRYGICSGGLTTYEFASQKVPFAIVCQVKHQLITAKTWEKLGNAKNFGMMSIKTKKRIIIFLKTLSEKNFHFKGKNVVDGLGSKRVAHEILNLIE